MNDRQPTDPSILFPPEALGRLVAGFDRLAALMAATLGPAQPPVLNARDGGMVELISDAGTIARRVLEIPGRSENTGAMILRHLAWRMHEQFGDGAATAAVLARAMVREGVKRIEAGVSPVHIRDGLERGLPVALAALAAQAEPASGQAVLAGVATGITGDPELGAVLGEIVDFLGPDAAITVDEFPIPYLDREYVEGAYWRAHPASRGMIPEGQAEVVLDQPLVFIADGELGGAADLLPALEIAAAGHRPLLIVPAKIATEALTTITANHARGTLTAVAAQLGASGLVVADELGDLAALTGATVMSDATGRPPRSLHRTDLGFARKAVVRRDALIVVDGAGDPSAVSDRTALVRRRLANISANDDEARRLQGRIARLSGGVAILKLGAHSETDLAHRRAQAEKAFRALTGLLTDGVLPGGGVAYLACIPAVQTVRSSIAQTAESSGLDVLLSALEALFLQIVRNHGLVHPPIALAEVQRRGTGYGFDALNDDYACLRERSILDSHQVLRGALQSATSAAISLLTTGAVILPPASRRRIDTRP